ncbi:MAG: transcriptional regulator [Pseudopedobacter saltans]|uniref:Transcriptional regulator n=1 Tax=Pseudopedobacter saltans TaxID=151895 RepID=A0A2W5ECI1_9SPHI|nr:MAG: transcriptional regulator [Pseudopedobacter saltans]
MLSKKTQYAFQALMYLAQNKKSGPILIAEIAQKKKIPLKFLENILLEMRKDGILESKKGKGGGYFLAKPPEKIVLADVMRLIEGPISLLPCVSKFFYEKCANCDEKTCGLRNVLINVRDANLAILEHQSVADIAGLN